MTTTERGIIDMVTNAYNAVKEDLPAAASAVMNGISSGIAGLERYRMAEKAKIAAMSPEEYAQYKEEKRNKTQAKRQARLNKTIEKEVARRVSVITREHDELRRQAEMDRVAMEKATSQLINAAANAKLKETISSRSVSTQKNVHKSHKVSPVRKVKTLATRSTIIPRNYTEPIQDPLYDDENSESDNELVRQNAEIYLGDDGYMHSALNHYPTRDPYRRSVSRHHRHSRHSR